MNENSVVPIADLEALEEAADVMLAWEAESVLAEGGPTVTMAELLTDLFSGAPALQEGQPAGFEHDSREIPDPVSGKSPKRSWWKWAKK